MLIDIDKIIIKDRIRKDYGNIEELAKDIKENGLINPPVVTPEYILIAGERRTKACKFLNYSQIEVRVMTVKDALHQLKLEISENENRKDFSFSEKMQWAEQLKEEYSKIAKRNQANSTGGINPQLLSTLSKAEKIDSNKQVANDLDMGTTTYRGGIAYGNYKKKYYTRS
ncbi:ParB N-terminal domain-containing protein [Clostridium botulinum]|uniref:ParB N-terminal domain-containing protein n=1 Tax=Clostridium botulinum TaxID=1491 RepID=UPI001FABBC13|nr:ParB N-terminal domain-containing protein [Clostridium botulinum]